MPGWRIVTCPVPDRLDAPDAGVVHALAALSSDVERERWGHDDLAYSAADYLTYLRNQEYAVRLQLLAVPDDASPATGADSGPPALLGTVGLRMPTSDNQHMVEVELTVHPEHRRQGIGGALLAECERIAVEHGRTTAMTFSEHVGEPAADDVAALEPPTGSGRLVSDAPAVTFALHRGYALEQTERYSVLALPVEPDLLDRLHAEAAERAGSDYRLVSWTDGAPDERLEGMAHLRTRMSTDVPRAGLDLEEEPWDAARVRRAEQVIADSGHGELVVAAEHVPSGALVAYTAVEYPRDRPAVVFQNDTLVLREHRGHRLGMLVKTGLLQRLAELRPHAARIHTWNAEENSYMLGINVALGFRRMGVTGLWQKRLGDAADDPEGTPPTD
jgi:GNAT superfamily N-acetyltransferase